MDAGDENKEIKNNDVESSDGNAIVKPEIPESSCIIETSQMSADEEDVAVAMETSQVSSEQETIAVAMETSQVTCNTPSSSSSSGQERPTVANSNSVVNIDEQKSSFKSEQNVPDSPAGSDNAGSNETLIDKDDSCCEAETLKPQLSTQEDGHVTCGHNLSPIVGEVSEGVSSAVGIGESSISAMDIIKQYGDDIAQESDLEETKSPEPDSVESVSFQIPIIHDTKKSEFTVSGSNESSVLSSSDIVSKNAEEELIKRTNATPCDSSDKEPVVALDSAISSSNDKVMQERFISIEQPECTVTSGSVVSFLKNIKKFSAAQADCTVSSGSAVTLLPEMMTSNVLPVQPECTVSSGSAVSVNLLPEMNASNVLPIQPECTVTSGSSFPETTKETNENDIPMQPDCTVSSCLAITSSPENTNESVKRGSNVTSSSDDSHMKESDGTPAQSDCTVSSGSASTSFPENTNESLSIDSALTSTGTLEQESVAVSDSGIVLTGEDHREDDMAETSASRSGDFSDSGITSSAELKGENEVSTPKTLEPESMEISNSGILPSEEDDLVTQEMVAFESSDNVVASETVVSQSSDPSHSEILLFEKTEKKIETESTNVSQAGLVTSVDDDLTLEKTAVVSDSGILSSGDKGESSLPKIETLEENSADIEMSDSGIVSFDEGHMQKDDLPTAETSVTSVTSESKISTVKTFETESADITELTTVEENKSNISKAEIIKTKLANVSEDIENDKGQSDSSSAEMLEIKSAVSSDSGTVSSLDGQIDKNALPTTELSTPKSSCTIDSEVVSVAAEKNESLKEKPEFIQDESLESTDTPPNTECETKSNEAETETEKPVDFDSKLIKTLPASNLKISRESNESEIVTESKQEVRMSDSMCTNVNTLEDDDSKSNLIKSESSNVEKHLESSPIIDLETNVPCTVSTESDAEIEASPCESEKKKNEIPDQNKGKTLVSVETSKMSDVVTEQKPADDVQSLVNTRDKYGDKTSSVKYVDEDCSLITSRSSSAVSDDNDTRSSANDSKTHGAASLRDEEDSRASFVSATNETEVDMDLAADESNPVPLADDVVMSDFNEDSNASKSIDPQPKQDIGNDKIFLAAEESNPVPLADDDIEMSDFNEDSNASKSVGLQPKQLNGNGKIFSLSDEASMSSVVSADSGDSENIPLARMVEESDNFPLSSLVPYSDSMPATPASVDTTSDAGPTPAKRSRHDSTNATEDELNGYLAENLFEYQWPQDGGEWYMLQEQLSEFLGIKSFKRKYPDLYRRTADKVEKDFIRERGVVTETQSDLGLTALRSEEVYDLMLKDYPDKYQEYANVLHEREKKTIREQHKEYGVPKLDKCKMADYIKKAVRSAAEFNAHIQRERREERRSYFDLQTFMIHYPSTKYKKLAPEVTKPGPYPVSLIPGQFQNFYKGYTPDELKYLPINTIMFDPPNNMGSKLAKPSSGDSSSEVEDNAEDKAESGSDDDSDGDDSSESGNSSSDDDDAEEEDEPQPAKVEICRICKEAVLPGLRKNSLPQDTLIKCSECGATGHPSCLDLPKKMVAVIKTYPWQCMECKTCVECMDPYDEDKMMFCDRCDRGYHTFCVGLKAIPTGRWECRSCKGTSDSLKARRSRH